jgi:hypothetical protein
MTDIKRTYILVTSSTSYHIDEGQPLKPPVMTVSRHDTMESVHRRHLADVFRMVLTDAESANKFIAEITDRIVFHGVYTPEGKMKDNGYEHVTVYRGDDNKMCHLMAEFKGELGKRFTEYVEESVIRAYSAKEGFAYYLFSHVVILEKGEEEEEDSDDEEEGD